MIRRGCDCDEHIVVNDEALCGYDGCWLDAPEDDQSCEWEPCRKCAEIQQEQMSISGKGIDRLITPD